jgi:hypothetical protein
MHPEMNKNILLPPFFSQLFLSVFAPRAAGASQEITSRAWPLSASAIFGSAIQVMLCPEHSVKKLY